MKKFIYLFFILTTILSCGIYSFNGASISSEIKTININYFKNTASTIQPTLSQTLTEKLKDYFTQQTNLKIDENNGDLIFKGEIIKYEIKPMAIQSNEIAGQNRLTISVKVDFENIFGFTFSFFSPIVLRKKTKNIISCRNFVIPKPLKNKFGSPCSITLFTPSDCNGF